MSVLCNKSYSIEVVPPCPSTLNKTYVSPNFGPFVSEQYGPEYLTTIDRVAIGGHAGELVIIDFTPAVPVTEQTIAIDLSAGAPIREVPSLNKLVAAGTNAAITGLRLHVVDMSTWAVNSIVVPTGASIVNQSCLPIPGTNNVAFLDTGHVAGSNPIYLVDIVNGTVSPPHNIPAKTNVNGALVYVPTTNQIGILCCTGGACITPDAVFFVNATTLADEFIYNNMATFPGVTGNPRRIHYITQTNKIWVPRTNFIDIFSPPPGGPNTGFSPAAAIDGDPATAYVESAGLFFAIQNTNANISVFDVSTLALVCSISNGAFVDLEDLTAGLNNGRLLLYPNDVHGAGPSRVYELTT